MMNDNWSEWIVLEFEAALDKWTRHNSVISDSLAKEIPKKKGIASIFGEDETQKEINCDKVVKTEKRKKILAAKH